MKRSIRMAAAALCFAVLCAPLALPAAAEEKQLDEEQIAQALEEKVKRAAAEALEGGTVTDDADGYIVNEYEKNPPTAFEALLTRSFARAGERTRRTRRTGVNFMEGMVLLPGAKGDNAEALALALYRWEGETDGVTKHLTNYVSARKAQWYNTLFPDEKILRDAVKKYGYCDLEAEGFLFCAAVRELKRHLAGTGEPGDYTDGADAAVWRALGLEVLDTFEAAFGKPGGGWIGGAPGPIKMKLEGNTLTFDYSPSIYVAREYEDWTLTDEEVEEAAENCVEGFKEWEGVYEVYGQALTVVVDVHPVVTGRKLFSDVRIVPRNGSASMVFGCIVWRPWSPFLKMSIKSGGYVSTHTPMHEFGHVLGLFDAYGYGSQVRDMDFLGLNLRDFVNTLLPEAPPDRAPEYSIMRSRWEVTPTEIEMLLWGWKSGRLQLYTESILCWLGAEVSQAFWH